MSSIYENLRCIEDRIDKAAAKSGRGRQDITLVTVTKTRSVEQIAEAIACGATDIGENYVQEAQEKYSEIGDSVRWHMIGHLQKNKARHAVEFFSLIQSVDSIELAEQIGRRALAVGRHIDVLLEVKISSEATKYGVDPDRSLELASKIAQVSGLKLCGLMGMAPFEQDPQDTRPFFRDLKTLWDKLPDEQRIYLSMGMTSDFEVAIEEGSNMVRIGTAIFGPRG
ncbi:MAG: YggS family pyridoxal phosphate-dependent enzyme [Armatimonadetes bacterium]|jgi:pyridoxal phosphate enzyme (YggS family)|nr:YggS family pyridoxal phosphate-dependent enzyme [Armatimonadota bacterium]